MADKMIYCVGLESELENIQQNLNGETVFKFRQFDQIASINDLQGADLLLIGPAVANPVKAVQQAVAKDKHISILIFVESARYNQVTQSIQFALFVGKNTSCVALRTNWNYHTVLLNGITRTKQRRSFNKFNRSAGVILSQLNSPAVRLGEVGDILEYAPMGALLVDNASNILSANKASRRMFKAFDGDSIRLEAIFPAKTTELLKTFHDSAEGAMAIVEDYNGNHYEISGSKIPGQDIEKTILLINDITEKHEKDKRFTAILESLPQIAWSADEEGSANYFNKGWFDYTNKETAEGMGDGWTAAVHPDDLTNLRARWAESVKEGKVFQHAFRLRRFDGEYRWHLSKAVPIAPTKKRITMWVGTASDIHDQVKINEELERKVKERTKLLEEMNAELEQFTHISSHDLQEPLRKIQTFAHIINDELAEGSANSETVKKYIEKIIHTSSRMSNLLKDLLNYSKIDQQEPLAVINLGNLIDEIMDDLEVAIARNGATITVEPLPVLNVRPLQIKQLFYNIINNALKYKKPGVPPAILISCRKLSTSDKQRLNALQQGDYWRITVKDNGIGFDQKYAEQIFTVFQRLHTRSSYEGTGIGLAIAKKVVHNHGGEIFAISSVGNGSEFHVVLPEFRVNDGL